MYYDATYILVIIGMLFCMIASARVKSVMKEHSHSTNSSGLSGAEAARQILNNEGLYDVQVECLGTEDGDHFDPRVKAVRLSQSNFYGNSVTALGVAAHECGHAIQHAHGYGPLNFRTALVPVVNIGSKVGVPMILVGVLLSYNQILIQIGIWAFALSVLFQVVTLPVEFNASSRAIVKLREYGMLNEDEIYDCKSVLRAAAMTYVASMAAAALQLLRLVLLFGGGRGRRRR